MDDVTEEATTFLYDNLKDKGEIFVAFSGGKDSVVTDKLMELSGLPYKLFYSFTGIDPPELVKFIRKNYPECVFLKPRRTFWRDLVVNVPPSNKLRWCCRLLKKEPAWKLPHKYRVMGIRKEESSARSKYERINHKEKLNHVEYYPIFYWNTAEVWEFIERHNLAYSSLYDEGFDRLGCVICPFHSEPTGNLHKMYRDRWPKFFDLFEKKIAELYYKRVSQGKQMYYNSPQEFCNAWYKNKNARWKVR